MAPVADSLRRNRVGSAPPTGEIGAVLNGVFSPMGMAPWTQFVDDDEYVPELRWPLSVTKYRQMSTDSQLKSLYDGTRLPVMHFNWQIDPNDADEEMVTILARDLNLPILGETNKKQPKLRQRKRFSFNEHLRKVLYAGIYGHYFFEQVGEIGDDGYWHLRKLAERPPKTINNIAVAPDGGLVYIEQNLSGISSRGNLELPRIPVDRLVAYVWEQEGGDWTGQSWFRECYRNWLLKDRLMRIDAVNHEKAGGVPIATAPAGSTPAEVRQVGELAKNFNVGMESGGGLPAGADITVVRAAGTDTVGSMRYHDEAMARRFLLMVLQLGQTTTGSRALGTTFVDFFGQGLSAIAGWVVDIFCDHVIEDFVDWNWGEDVEPVPRLAYEFDPELAVTDLVELVSAQAIIVDDELENELRREMGLPLRTTARPKDIISGGGKGAGGGAQNPADGNPGNSNPNPKNPKAEREVRATVASESAPSLANGRSHKRIYDHEEDGL